MAASAEIDDGEGTSHGAQPRAVPEGAQRSGIRRAVWYGGQVPGGGDGLTLAERLRVPGLRRTSVQRGDDAAVVPVQRLPPSDLADCGYHLRRHPSAPAPVV